MLKALAKLALPVALLASLPAAADPVTSVPAAFMEQLVRGINARDLKGLRPLIHPATLACMTPQTERYYGWVLWRNGSKRYTIPESYQTAKTAPLPLPEPQKDPFVRWPATPDAAATLTYSPAPKTSLRRLFEWRQDKGREKLLMDCPTPAGLDKFRKMAQEEAARRKKLTRLWKSMDAADRQAFTVMATEGMQLKMMDAAERKYRLTPDESLAFMDMVEYGDMP